MPEPILHLMVWRRCPECKGEGMFAVQTSDSAEQLTRGLLADQYQPCAVCKGTGEVQDVASIEEVLRLAMMG